MHVVIRPALLVAALLVGAIGGFFTSAEPAWANTNSAGFWVGTTSPNYCDGTVKHLPNLYGYPYAGTLSGQTRGCFATEAIVYWGPYSADSGQHGAVTEIVGGSQGSPYQSAHLMCWALFQCSGWFWLY